MQSQVDDFFAAPASGAIAQGIRVHLNTSGQWTASGATTLHLATLTRDAFASQTTIPVAGRLANSPGVAPYVANGTINAYSEAYTAANGKVSSVDNRTAGGFGVGTTLAAAAADGDIIPVLQRNVPSIGNT